MGSTTDETRVPLADALDAFVRSIGRVVCWANAILILVIILQVVLRYGFGRGLVIYEELQWHLYAVAAMVGMSYAQSTNSHIRVDVITTRLSSKTTYMWEIFGILVFVFPFIFIVFSHSLDFVAESWRVNERSDAPLGLPWRWAIKSVIPISFALLALAVTARLVRVWILLVRGK